ncbi:HAD family hydrolase [Dictyobacter kobayashii]|uniref:Haloacid dehalogenase n=1 Tax=Dictyobacter kobayashii TaxID=2014872 RepID=A0A402AW37_9CHLR|nr:HAD family hydrolase [Dictyobacter kobayashii]GCE23360.1 haloacid dehalogenase [Dictyobacter kobayashii]
MPYTLCIDADDTLWENNIYFEQATSDFIHFLNHSSLQPAEIEAVLNEVQLNIGYGFANFTRSLIAVYQQLAEREVNIEDIAQIRRFGQQLASHPMEIMPGVEKTLIDLTHRHQLILLTKGHAEEQQLKIERSGLAGYFEHTIVVPEKHPLAYRKLVQELQLQPASTWMIGNSPRSDINSARAANLNTVYIPHPHTWTIELQEIETVGPGKHLTLQTFSELSHYF